jgi:hypothetical protein
MKKHLTLKPIVMKTTIIYAFLVSVLFIGFTSCDNKKNVAQDLKSATTPDTTSICGLDNSPQQKLSSEAITELTRYSDYYERLEDNEPASEFEHQILGIQVTEIQELFEVLCAIKDDSTKSLYIMNAIKDVENKDGEMVSETDMIFVVVPTNSAPESVSETETEPLANSYFDFTSPCPAACPTVEGIVYPDTPSN